MGQRFGRLKVLNFVKRDKKHSYWQCVCDCGGFTILSMNTLRRGLTRSCGCLNKELASSRATTHGFTKGRAIPSEYRIWAAMKRRCTNPNCPEWHRYGGRGIIVCDRWTRSFEAFLEDMGPRPDGMTLDRVDNNGNYESKNCRWASCVEQSNNRRDNHIITVGAKKITLLEACKFYGVRHTTVYSRISRGWPESRWFEPKH